MENTNECDEMVALDSMGDCFVEQSEGVVRTYERRERTIPDESIYTNGEIVPGLGTESDFEPREIAPPAEENEDATMRVLRLYPKVCARIAELMNNHAEAIALELIEKGMSYDDAIAEADKGGYLRGKNEKIELVKRHRMPQLDRQNDGEELNNRTIAFPRYKKKNFWEK